MSRAFLVPIVLGVLAGSSAHAAGPRKIAILEVKVEGGADPVIGSQLTARLASTLGSRPNITVIAPDDLRAMLEQQQQKQMLGCSDDGCLAEIAGALGVDAIIAGKASKADNGYTIAASMIDSQNAKVLGRAVETWKGESIGLLDLVDPIVDQLFSEPGVKLVGLLEIEGAVSGSRILIDDQVRGTAPAGQLADIPIGARKIQVIEEDHEPFERWVVVKKGARTSVAAQQKALEASPFYAKWWFWTIAGVAVAGAAVGTVVIAGGGGTGGSQTGVNVSVSSDAAFSGDK